MNIRRSIPCSTTAISSRPTGAAAVQKLRVISRWLAAAVGLGCYTQPRRHSNNQDQGPKL
jgi:hypothetical protein